METERYPSYYSVIPALVRYDKELTYFEIILYGELVAMATLLGYCYCTNDYLERLYNVSTPTITRAIQKLSKRGHIFVKIDQAAGNERKIYVVTPPLEKVVYGGGIVKNDDTPIIKNDDSSRTGKASASLNKHNLTKRLPNDTVPALPAALVSFFKDWPK